VTWVSVLTLLILAASFVLPPFGYAILLTRQVQEKPVRLRALVRELMPYVVAQWFVIAVVICAPQLVWHRNPLDLPTPSGGDEDAGRDALIEQLRQNDTTQSDGEAK
jgi:hypothetical protein